MSQENIFDIKNISKEFPGTLALDDVSFSIRRGEIHAICGENGAGKSTLMHILAGNLQQNSGTIFLEGKEINNINPKAMQDLGVGIVYQETSLIGSLNVADNIFPDRHVKSKLGFIDLKATNSKAKELLDLLKIDISPTALVSTLSPAIQQMVEIAKAISLVPKVLILDEPTSAITENETKILFNVLRDLKSRGLTVIYISHRIAEIFELADRVSVLKDGKYICTKDIDDTDTDQIVMYMVGRNIEKMQENPYRQDSVNVEFKSFSSTRFKNISFSVRYGEILTLTGLAGAGRTEFALAVFGADPYARGEIVIGDRSVPVRNVRDAMSAGIGYMPEDRKEQGLFLDMSIMDNIISGNLGSVTKKGAYQNKKALQISQDYKEKLGIVAPNVKKIARLLSGGNQQKVIIAKWLLDNPKLLIVDEPTRGVDVGAKAEIYGLLRDFVKDGRSVLVISSDMAEVLSISDRILIMSKGTISGELLKEDFSEEKILRYAAGLS